MSPGGIRLGGTMMSRLIFVLALSGLTASMASAKDLCIQLDSSVYSGSHVALKKVKLAPGTSAPLQGYFAHYDPNNFSYDEASPVAGASVVNASGTHIGLGLDLYSVDVSANGMVAVRTTSR